MALNHNRHQYQFDMEGLAGPPNKDWQSHLYDEGGSPLGLHFFNLFDQNEDGAGELWDHATGKKIDNSTYDGMEDLRVIDPGENQHNKISDDLLGPVID